MNARAETIGEKPAYKGAWRRSQLCLVPMQAFFEPCYETGKAIRTRISLASGEPFAVAGMWREWQEPDGGVSHAFTQITINADDHALMRRMHKPG
ncbi:SOS response-associated peptidase [Chromobacterium vaccinii]|nr:SOS response-associated peptidase [Chromobacterium vaccinii]